MGNFWAVPGATGCIDLRCGREDGFGFAVFSSRQTIPDGLELGDDLASAMKQTRSRVSSFLGLPNNAVESTSLREVIAELLISHGDPTGQKRWKPLRGGFKKGIPIYLGGMIWKERFDLAHQVFRNVREVFQVDYRKHKVEIDRLPVKEADAQFIALRKYTGGVLRNFRLGENSSAILPFPYRKDGFLNPATVINESFNTGDSDILGPDLSWTEQDGDIDIVTNRARSTGGGINAAQATTNLATDDHYSEALVWNDQGTAARVGTGCRQAFSTSVYGGMHNNSGNLWEIIKRNPGTSVLNSAATGGGRYHWSVDKIRG